MRFLYNTPALFHRGALIIGDTHFGIEERLRKKGINASGISEQICNAIEKLIDQTRAKKLILLGDVKDNITTLDKRTRKAIATLKRKTHVIIVRGNHDGGIEELGVEIIPASGFVYQGLGLVHGHSWPAQECMNANYLVSAHQHLLFEQRDRLGKRHVAPAVFVLDANINNIAKFYKKFNKKIRLILLPAFNYLVGSGLKYHSDEHLGPLFRNKLFKYNDAEIYSLKGSYLGKIKKIKQTKAYRLWVEKEEEERDL